MRTCKSPSKLHKASFLTDFEAKWRPVQAYEKLTKPGSIDFFNFLKLNLGLTESNL